MHRAALLNATLTWQALDPSGALTCADSTCLTSPARPYATMPHTLTIIRLLWSWGVQATGLPAKGAVIEGA